MSLLRSLRQSFQYCRRINPPPVPRLCEYSGQFFLFFQWRLMASKPPIQSRARNFETKPLRQNSPEIGEAATAGAAHLTATVPTHCRRGNPWMKTQDKTGDFSGIMQRRVLPPIPKIAGNRIVPTG